MNARTGTLMALLLVPPSALADGGALRLSQRQGPYRVSVFTAPTPLRAGPADVSVLVQGEGGEPLPEVSVRVRASPHGRPGVPIEHAATTEAATNKLFKSAVFELPAPGEWDLEVIVDGPHGSETVRLTVAVEEASPSWPALWPWFGWPALAVVLFGVHCALVRRRRREKKRGQAPQTVAQSVCRLPALCL